MKIEIPDELVDEIVKDELKKAYLLNHIPDKYDLSDDEIEVNIEFINALYTVMEYFIPEDELYAWMLAKDGRLGRTEHAKKTDNAPSEYVNITTGHIMQKEKKVRNTLDDIDYVDTFYDTDISSYGISISADGKRVDPKDFYEYKKVDLLEEVPCKTHPDAPHGFNRNASHAEGRYVCDCEYWEPED